MKGRAERELRRRLAAARREAHVFPGPGTLLHRTSNGTIWRAAPASASFTGAWFVDISSDRATIAPGRINLIMAKIGKVPLDDAAPPELRLANLSLDDEGRGYICAECFFYGLDEPGADGEAAEPWSVREVQIVQVSNPDSEQGEGTYTNASGAARALEGRRARWPLAMIRERDGGALDVFQIEWFDLKHRAKLFEDGPRKGEAKRHFFY